MALRDSPATAWYQFNGNPISVSHSCYDGYSRDKEETDSVETRQETAGRHNTAKRGNPTQDLTDSFQISFGMEFKHNGVEFIHVASPPRPENAKRKRNGRESPPGKKILPLGMAGRIQ